MVTPELMITGMPLPFHSFLTKSKKQGNGPSIATHMVFHELTAECRIPTEPEMGPDGLFLRGVIWIQVQKTPNEKHVF
jgi:hypothetical protein